MKKFLAGFLLCALVSGCAYEHPDVVEHPYVIGNITQTLDVAKVEMNDSATVLSFDLTFRPGWWYVVSDGTYIVAEGDTLPLLSADGVVINERNITPENGKHSFSLTFGPIKKSARNLSFIESENWKIWGIDLTGEAKPAAELPAAVTEAMKGEVNTDFNQKMADTRFTVHILDYSPEIGQPGVTVYTTAGESYEGKLVPDENGVATFTAPVYGTSHLIIGRRSILVAPEESIDIYYDPRDASEITRHRQGQIMPERYLFDTGRYAAFNELNSKYGSLNYVSSSNPALDNCWKMSGSELIDSILSARNSIAADIDTIDAPDNFKAWLKRTLDANALSSVFSAQNTMFGALINKYDNINYQQAMDSTKFAAMPDSADLARAVKALGADKEDFDFLYVRPEADYSKYGAAPGAHASYLFNQAYRAAFDGDVKPEITEELKALDNPFYLEAIEARTKVRKAALEEMRKTVQPTPEVADDKVFDAIIAPHKGKVVLVDLWNTWCGPCRNALKANEPLKSGELADDDIVWIYIADTSSNPTQYMQMIPDIKGLHYNVSSDQIAAIRNRFKVDGIPYYILVDREGNATGHPDFRDHSVMVKGIKAKL